MTITWILLFLKTNSIRFIAQEEDRIMTIRECVSLIVTTTPVVFTKDVWRLPPILPEIQIIPINQVVRNLSLNGPMYMNIVSL